MRDIHKAVRWAVDIANDSAHGYDQRYRNGPDYDCSSFVSAALIHGGFNISPYSWTGNMVEQLKREGFYEVPITAKRQTGDIFIHTAHHVVMCVNNITIVQASINESGGIVGGAPGDQTGREICECSYYVPSYGWEYHLRPPDEAYNTEAPPARSFTVSWSK